jgi:hypothetical protein
MSTASAHVESAIRDEILVLREEDLFFGFTQSFEARRYRIRYATAPDELSPWVEQHAPALLVWPLEALGGRLPGWFAELRAQGVKVLATSGGPAPLGDDLPAALADAAVDRFDPRAAEQEARRLLGERRLRPRVAAPLSVTLEGGHRATVLDLSATSLRVQGDRLPAAPSRCEAVLKWGARRVAFTARVRRAAEGAPTQRVLQLEEDDPATRVLDRVVRRLLEVGHYRQQDGNPAGTEGPVTWQVARRAEKAFRQTRELQPLLAASAPEDASEAGLSSRYALDRPGTPRGVGVTARAIERLRNRPVVLKILREDLRDDAPARARMEMEARVGHALSDLEGVASVLDFGSDNAGGLYYATENLRGESLADVLTAGTCLGPRSVARLGIRVAETLARAHRRGYGHFDLCPEAIWLQRSEGGSRRPLLLDFAADLPPDPPALIHARGAAYWPPEAEEAPLDESREAYALCAVLREAYPVAEVGRPGPGAGEARRRLRELLRAGTSSRSGERFSSLAELVEQLRVCGRALEAAITGPPARIRLPDSLRASEGSPTRSSGVPATRTSEVPATRSSEVPATRSSDVPATRTFEGSPTRSSEVSATRSSEVPATRTFEGSPTRTSEVPATRTSEVPATRSSEVSATRSSEVPATRSSEVPATRSSEVPATRSSEVPATRTSEVPATRASSDDLLSPASIGEPTPASSAAPALAGGPAVFSDPTAQGPPTRSVLASPAQDRRKGRKRLAVVSAVLLSAVAVGAVLGWPLGAPGREVQPTTDVAGVAVPAAPSRPPAPGAPGPQPGWAAPELRVGPAPPSSGASSRDGAEPPEVPPSDPGASPVDEPPPPGSSDPGREGADVGRTLGERWVAKTPMQKHRVYLRIGRWNYLHGDAVQARQYLTRSLEYGDSASLRRLFARTYEDQRQLWPAIHHQRRAVALAPGSWRYQLQLGRLLLEVGKRAKACRALATARSLAPEHPHLARHLRRHCGSRPAARRAPR